jgi:hypothetical protein
MNLSFSNVLAITDGRLGTFDSPCPLCAGLYNPRKRVLRIWHEEPGFARFNCARCNTAGWVKDKHAASSTLQVDRSELRRKMDLQRATELSRQRRKAQWLWKKSLPLCGTPAERYLRAFRGYGGVIPSTLRFLPPHKPEHHPAMIAAFGIPNEPEPGALGPFTADDVQAVHLTLLLPDGAGKADVRDAKLTVSASDGYPIVIAPPNDCLGLAVTEGIEDALSISEVTGLGVWAAGSANRLPTLAPMIPTYLDCITIVMDPDPAGQKNSRELAWSLSQRDLNVQLVAFSTAQEGRSS